MPEPHTVGPRLAAGWLLAVALAGCSSEKSSAWLMPMKSDSASGASTPVGGEWHTLFDGPSIDAWRGFKREGAGGVEGG